MVTLPLGSPPPATVDLLRAAPWMDDKGRRTGHFELIDQARLGASRLLIVGTAEGGHTGARWFVPVLDADPGRAADEDAAFHRDVVDALREGLRLPTRRGNLIEFRGRPEPYRDRLPFDPGWCSNALALLDLGGTAHAHKTYRRIDSAIREPELLRMMADSGRTQQPVGDYTYLDTVTGRCHPLGVLYRYAEGEGLNVPLRASIRALWPLLHAGTDPLDAVAESQRLLTEPLRATGRFLRGFHQDLAERLGPHADFPVEACLWEAARKLAELTPLVLTDPRIPAAVREAVATGLTQELARIADLPRGEPWRAGPCHGDLHLSHLLRRERADGSWELCIIDLSTPPSTRPTRRRPSRPGRTWPPCGADWKSSPRTSSRTRPPNISAWIPRTPAAPPSSRPPAPGPTLLAGPAQTRRAGAAALGRAHVGRPRRRPAERRRPRTGRAPAWRLFRLRRLIHELDYAYAHDRAYHAAINLRHAVEASGPPASR